MTPLGRFRWGMAGIAVGLLITLMLLPSTGWIARQEIGYQLFPWSGLTPGLDMDGAWTSRLKMSLFEKGREDAMRDAADARPDDLRVQMASALRLAKHEDRPEALPGQVPALQPLLKRFPERPELYATLIRFLSMKQGARRPEEALLDGSRLEPQQTAPPAGQKRRPWELMREYAASGERLEPDNAFFPAMAAVASMAMRDDDAALAGLARAARGSRWHDYAEEEPNGEIALREGAFGRQSAVTELAVSAAVLLPHYAKVRSMARTMTYLAMKQEEAGQLEAALRSRLELIRLGSLLRAAPSSIIGSLVGMAIEDVAAERPGGSPRLHSSGKQDSDAVRRERISRFVAYVREHASPDQAAWAQAELETAVVVRKTVRAAVRQDYFLGPALKVAVLRVLDWAWLGSAFWIGLIALGSWLGRLARPGDEPAPFARYFPWTVVYALGAGALFMALDSPPDAAPVAAPIGMALIAIAGLWSPVSALFAHGWGEGLKRLGIWALAAAVAAALIVWQLPSLVSAPGMIGVLFGMGQEWDAGGTPQEILPPLLPLLAPLALLLILALAAALRREPVSTGAVRLLSVTAMPVVAALLVGYAVSVVQTSRAEKQASAAIAGMLSGEGKYAAGLIGKPWPGPAPVIP